MTAETPYALYMHSHVHVAVTDPDFNRIINGLSSFEGSLFYVIENVRKCLLT